ncbi:MAG: helix-turn-helix transcriptional regulator [Mesorhizobium sp.]|uniref:helix-turn-helix domain-containing protein n=1 Tax=Mesorhizobium sp. TaxID=1871066 RepID=UPI001ACA9D3C|nr:helix-turn-helix transcriptional regulator [Mesorhizobium sp.]MBN9220435.1 helix-turn-helix transcriptional regulator [Mesorhizobium sp.]
MPQNAKSHASSEVSENGPIYTTLKAMREARGYSVEELSLTCGLAVDEIDDIENGREFDPAKLRRVATALRLPEDTLVASAAAVPAAQGRPLA